MWRVEIAARFREDRFHEAEAIGTHCHAADSRHGNLCAKLTTESATGRIRCRYGHGKLTSSLFDAAVAEVDIRAGDHMGHFGLEAAAGTAGDGTDGSDNASSDARVALHKASLNGDHLKLYGDRDVWRHITPCSAESEHRTYRRRAERATQTRSAAATIR